MDIVNPNSLWRDYDITALPLNETHLSDKTENGINIKAYYFDGFTTTDGRVRAYIKILENPSARGVILYLGDRHGTATDDVARSFYDFGFTVATLDYLGESADSAMFTLYPQSLDDCNNYGKTTFDAPSDPLNCCWFVWTCMARRALLLIKNHYPDSVLFALGKGLGGSTVYKLAIFDDGLSACATMLNVLPEVHGDANSMIGYRAAFDNNSYAPFGKVPMFITVASNDEDSSLDDMAELASGTASLRGFRIVQRSFADGINVVYPQIYRFFTAGKDKPDYYMHPTVTAKNSENKLYFNINIKNGAPQTDRVELFTSFCVDNPSRRNWMSMPPLGIGDGEYMANADVLRNEKHVYAFVNVTDDNGDISSSPLLSFIPKSLGIPSMTAVGRRLIYDGSMGTDVWMSQNGGKITATSGYFGIDGVKSDKHALATFKPGDPMFQGANGSLLQIMVCGEPQEINVAVSSETDTYYCKIKIPNSGNWHKITLDHFDFKGANGPLSDWSKVIMLAFNADNEFIIGSVLWV